MYHNMNRRKDQARFISKERLIRWLTELVRQRKSVEKIIIKALRAGGGKGNTSKRLKKFHDLTKQICRLYEIYTERFGDEDLQV